jgi:hypothetical protein
MSAKIVKPDDVRRRKLEAEAVALAKSLPPDKRRRWLSVGEMLVSFKEMNREDQDAVLRILKLRRQSDEPRSTREERYLVNMFRRLTPQCKEAILTCVRTMPTTPIESAQGSDLIH